MKFLSPVSFVPSRGSGSASQTPAPCVNEAGVCTRAVPVYRRLVPEASRNNYPSPPPCCGSVPEGGVAPDPVPSRPAFLFESRSDTTRIALCCASVSVPKGT